MENMEETQVEQWKDMEIIEETPGWIVKRFGKYGRQASWIVKRYGKW